MDEHLSKLAKVLDQWKEVGLLKPSKCHFAKSRVRMLGFIAGREEIEADPLNIRAVAQFP